MSNSETLSKPKLSVVIASQNALKSVSDCLNTVKEQLNGESVEIVVVDNSTDGTSDIIKREFPQIKHIQAEKEKLIPELWGIGVNNSAGDFVALTTSHFVPSKNWVEEILKAHTGPHAGVGGAIENDEKAGLVSWAVYFCRYSPYMLPFIEMKVNDFAADNASYKRGDLEKVKHAMEDGFWESFIHSEMLKKGMSLLKTPNIIVYHQQSFTFAGFIIQRFWHGREFGSKRALSLGVPKRIVFILLSPLIPFLYLFRITRRVLDKKKHISKYILSLPILILFLVSWATGEFSGYLRRARG